MNYYTKNKNNLIDVEIHNKVKDYSKNKYTLEKYYEIGKLIIEAQGGETRAKYGDGLIKEYSNKLKQEGINISVRNLKYIRKFYLLLQKGTALPYQLTWTHWQELLFINDTNKINYYIDQIINRNLSTRQLRKTIKNQEYERLPEDTKQKLINKEELTIKDEIKDPIIIKSSSLDRNNITEKILHQLILENMKDFLNQLGAGFLFVDSEYKIKYKDTFNYIDLLLFNTKYNSYVVVELKITELRKEHIGQIQVYMEYIDREVK